MRWRVEHTYGDRKRYKEFLLHQVHDAIPAFLRGCSYGNGLGVPLSTLQILDKGIYRRFGATHAPAFLGIRTSKPSSSFCVLVVIIGTVMFIAIARSVPWVLFLFHEIGLLVIEHDIPHTLQGDLDFFALLHHVVYLLQPRH